MIIDLDNKKNAMIFASFFICMICLFIYSLINNFIDNNIIYSFLVLVSIILIFFSERKDENSYTKNKYRIVSFICLAVLTFFKGWINIPMLVFSIILGCYFVLRGFNILKFIKTNIDSGEYEYL